MYKLFFKYLNCKALLTLYILLSISLLNNNIFAQKKETTSYIVDNHQFEKFTHNGIWSWFSDPRAVYHKGKDEKIYTGWVDNYGDIYVATYNLKSQKINVFLIYDGAEIDDHNNPSILVDYQGFIHVFFTSHTIDQNPIYYFKSSKSEDISKWDNARTLTFGRDKNINNTYSNPIELKSEDNKIYLFWRGINSLPSFSFSKDSGETWENPQTLFKPNEKKESLVPYTKVFSNNESRIHFTFTNAHPKAKGLNKLYYTYYENGYFYKANGDKTKSIEQLPLTKKDLDIVYKSNDFNVWNWDISEDENGKPILGFAVFESLENHVYYYSTFKNGVWQNNRLVNSGNWFPENQNSKTQLEPYYSGGFTINHSNPNTVYLSIKQNGIFEIEKWKTKNNGVSWTKSKITENSKRHNIRPYAIKNVSTKSDMQVLWLELKKYKYYNLSSKEIRTFEDRFASSILSNIKPIRPIRKWNKSNLIKLAYEYSALAFKNLNQNKFSKEFNVYLNALKSVTVLTKNETILSELENWLQANGDEAEIENMSNEQLLWYNDIDESRQIAVKLSELDYNSLDITKNINDFSLLTRLIDTNPDSYTRENAVTFLKKKLENFEDFNWFKNGKFKKEKELLVKSQIIYLKIWIHKNGYSNFSLSELKDEMKSLYNLAFKNYESKENSYDIETLSFFMLATSEFIINIDEY